MWYVIQVRVSSEESIKKQCEKRIPETVLQSCFIPYYESKRKVAGTWKTKRKILFPGYVFLVSDDAEQLFLALKKVEGLTKLLGSGGDVVALSEKEVATLRRLGGDEQVMEMSEGIIVGSRVAVRTGPLCGLEGCIRKIDRHKRKAWLELQMFGREQIVEVGLEITEKISAERYSRK